MPDDEDAYAEALTGELDLVSVPPVKERLLEVLAGGRRNIRLDLAGLDFIDSTAIGALIAVHQEASRRGGHLVLVEPSDRAVRAFELTGVDRLFDIEDGSEGRKGDHG